jgi:F0F1-type ATP synthase assembly protein I
VSHPESEVGPLQARSREVQVTETRSNDFSRYMRRSTGSYELVLSPVLLALIGFGIDRLLGTGPVFVTIFAVVGFAGASVKLYFGYKTEMELHESEAPWKTR